MWERRPRFFVDSNQPARKDCPQSDMATPAVPTPTVEPVAAPAAISSERARILSALLDDLQALTDGAVAAIRAEIPAYRDQDKRILGDLSDQVREHYRIKLTCLLEERTLTLEDLAFVRGAATRRARAGLKLEDYLNAFRVGGQVLWEAVMTEAGESPAGHEAALTIATPLMNYTDLASTNASNAYVEFQQYMVADADRSRRDLLERLLNGELPTGGPLLATAQRFGIGEQTRTAVAIAVPLGECLNPEVPHAASAAIAHSGLHEAQTLVVARQSEIIAVPVLGPGGDELELCDRLESVQERLRQEGMPVAIGISTLAGGVGELPRAHAEARAALDLLGETGGVAALPRLSPFQYLVLRADDTAVRLVDPDLRGFLDEDRDRGGVLTATIRAFAAADLNLRAAAEELQIHPNTARYRLSRVEERTGRNPRRIADLLDLLIAIALRDDTIAQQ
jgi:sugar diacid utilization regulator